MLLNQVINDKSINQPVMLLNQPINDKSINQTVDESINKRTNQTRISMNDTFRPSSSTYMFLLSFKFCLTTVKLTDNLYSFTSHLFRFHSWFPCRFVFTMLILDMIIRKYFHFDKCRGRLFWERAEIYYYKSKTVKIIFSNHEAERKFRELHIRNVHY